jgi:DNA-binding NtrC family response regulator
MGNPDRRDMRERILVADDDKAFRIATLTLLEDEGYRVEVASNGEEAIAKLTSGEFDLLLSDLVMGKLDGMTLLQRVKSEWPDLQVIMVTGFGSIQTAVEAMRVGASDYLTKPCNNDELLIKIRRTLDLRNKDRELKLLREELRTTYSFGNMISRSDKMKEIIRQIQLVADTDVTVLVQGESGTGKELVARALHFNSKRQSNPFVVMNCSAIPESLLESELFGYEKGAFTGATKQRSGKFEEAHTGTLFLDEIGDISHAVQTKLLRVLQEKTFERVGGNDSITTDIRIVVATNRDIELMMQKGDFREDLYYRLNVYPIMLPPLRERLEDLPLLTEHFVHRHTDLSNGRVQNVAPGVISEMMNYTWRGNVRELENLIKRALIKTTGDTITSIELPSMEAIGQSPSKEQASPPNLNTPFKDYVSTIIRDAEEKYLQRMLRLYKGNINQVAKLMDVDRKTVYRKMAEYSINPDTYRE